MNILILAGGPTDYTAGDENYPLCLTELDGKPLLQHLIENCSALGEAQYIIALPEREIHQFHLDDIVTILKPSAKVISVKSGTRGAACTALLAAGYVETGDELLILNGNEILDIKPIEIINTFRARRLDAGVVTFPSIHPRYSYVRLSSEGLVTEAAEKRPISQHATVGFYWFSRGSDFINSIKKMIQKDASINDLFYICPALNELVLTQASIGTFPIEASKYFPLKSARQLRQAEANME